MALSSVKAGADSNPNLQIIISPVQCSLDFINSGPLEITNVSPEECAKEPFVPTDNNPVSASDNPANIVTSSSSHPLSLSHGTPNKESASGKTPVILKITIALGFSTAILVALNYAFGVLDSPSSLFSRVGDLLKKLLFFIKF